LKNIRDVRHSWVSLTKGVVQLANVLENSHRRATGRQRFLCWVLLLAASLGPPLEAHGHAAKTRTAKAASHEQQAADQLSIQIHDDRLTLAVARAPQVYLYGAIDAGAPQRFAALMKSWKISAGSDIYLDSAGGDLSAGLALGRLFRAGSMVTHLGAPRRPLRAGARPKAAQCVDACAYAYLGGLYRWAPSGTDRIGLHASHALDPKAGDAGMGAASSADVASYLRDMGIHPGAMTPTPTTTRDDIVWLTPDPMLAAGLANNGRLPLTASYQPSSGAPYLSLNQTVRGGVNRITLECRPDGLTLTSYYMVGVDHARQIAARTARSYLEVDRQETLPLPRGSARVVSQAVTMSRPYSLDQLARLLSARSLGAWLGDRNGAVRYGFAFGLDPVRSSLRDYYARCQQVVRGATPAAKSFGN
jgi:hypothetical protein